MAPYCRKSSKFTNNRNTKIKYEIDEKNNRYSYSLNSGCTKFEKIDKEVLSNLFKTLN